jgi:hypothetical protein
MEFTFRVEQPGRDVLSLPNHRHTGGRYSVRADSDGSVEILGDRDGLLYLAEVIVSCALADLSPGFHVHLPIDGVANEPDTEAVAEVTVYSATTLIAPRS